MSASHHEAPHSPLLPDADRPHLPPASDGTVTPTGRAGQQTLRAVHEHLRQELAQIQHAAAQVAAGQLTAAEARSLINTMTLRQNYWTFGAFCAQYCRVVTVHHTIEDRYMFPALREEDEALSAVLNRLGEEHEIIAEVLDRFDRQLVDMLANPDGVEEIRAMAEELGDALLSHFAYEENELLGPLGRSSIVV